MRLFFILSLTVTFCFTSATKDEWKKYEEAVKVMGSNALIQDIWDDDHYPKFAEGRHQEMPEGAFTCPSPAPSATPPSSVHRLKPVDVSVVGAIGDSITAANGALATSVFQLTTQYRGRSWSAGGDATADTVVTMPNILRKVGGDNVKGHSTGKGSQGSSDAGFNYAVPGSVASDLLDQAKKMVSAMKSDPSVDFEKDWKVVTVFIGGNDVCDFHNDKPTYSPQQYIGHIQAALDHLHAHLPRTFVNLAELLDLSVLPDLSKGLICPLLHNYLCKAVAKGHHKEEVHQLINDYNQEIRSLVGGGRYDVRDNFTVVVQPFLRDTVYPKQAGKDEPDWSFWAPDCFHFSAKGHAAAAEGLWNNMMEPVGRKRTEWHLGSRVICPTPDNPYLATYQNAPSGLQGYESLTMPSKKSFMDEVPLIAGFLGAICIVNLIGGAVVVYRKRHLWQKKSELLEGIEEGGA